MARPGTDEDLDRWKIAYHEAGHAVVHRVAGGQVKKVEILRNGGGITVTAEDGPADDDGLIHWLVMILAGGEAEARFLVRKHGQWRSDARRAARPTCSSDLSDFRQAAKGSSISESKARNAAEVLVRKHWRRIDKVAALLFAKGKLTGSQV
jgi:hypothetical protein